MTVSRLVGKWIGFWGKFYRHLTSEVTKEQIIILAAGPRRLFWKRCFKQLAPIAGEKLLHRTLRQLHERGRTVIVVTHLPEIQQEVPSWFVPDQHKWYVSTVIATQPLWADKTVVLQGDVIYSESILDAILNGQEFPRFYGYKRDNEVHGWTFLREHHETLLEACEELLAVAVAMKGKLRAQQRHVYRYLSKRFSEELWITLPEDFTTDIDSAKDYLKWLEKNPWAREARKPK